MLICSPNGRYYGYYITENSINGYTVSYRDEAEITDGYQDNNRSDIVSQPVIKSTGSTVEVGTTNTYQNTRDMRLIGTKRWEDYGESELIYGKHPEDISITLKRHTESEAGQGNQVVEEDVTLLSVPTEGEPYIQWEKGTANVWTYTIHNLERYAPNGMPYVYTVTEEPVAGYNQQTRTVSGEAPAKGDLKLSAFVNNFGKSYFVPFGQDDATQKPTSLVADFTRIPELLPATAQLEAENIFVMTAHRAITQDIRPLRVLILNLMPTKIATETQILRMLSNTPLQVEIELLQTSTHEARNVSSQHLEEFYRSFEELRAIMDAAKAGDRLGVCLDTCHVYDAGYDIVGDLDGVLEAFDRVIGLDRLRAEGRRLSHFPCIPG